MAERSLRGMGIGTKSLESDANVDFAPRSATTYVCPMGHRTIVNFSETVQAPKQWECHCGRLCHLEEANEGFLDENGKPLRSHWDMLQERRSKEDLEKLLEKRLKMHREGWIPDYE